VSKPCHMIFLASHMVSLHPKALLVIFFSDSDLIVIEIQTSHTNLRKSDTIYIEHFMKILIQNLHHPNLSYAAQYDHWPNQNYRYRQDKFLLL